MVSAWLQGGDRFGVGSADRPAARCSCSFRSCNRFRCRWRCGASLDPDGTDAAARQRARSRSRLAAQPRSASTRVYIGRAAAALAVFLVAFHLASGRQPPLSHAARDRRRSGIAAVVIGLGHRIFGVAKLYGLLAVHGAVAADRSVRQQQPHRGVSRAGGFVCLACSFLRRTALNRVGWLVGAVLCARRRARDACHAARSLALAMGVAGVRRFSLRSTRDGGGPTARRRAAIVAAACCWSAVIVLGAGALGADQLIERFKAGAIDDDSGSQLWRDGFARPGRAPARHRPGRVRSRVSHLPDDEDAVSAPVRVRRERAAPAV